MSAYSSLHKSQIGTAKTKFDQNEDSSSDLEGNSDVESSKISDSNSSIEEKDDKVRNLFNYWANSLC